MPVKVLMNEPDGGQQVAPHRRGFFPVEIVLVPGDQKVDADAYRALERNCDRLKGAIADAEVFVLREDPDDPSKLIVRSELTAPVTYRANKYIIPANAEHTLSDKEWAELRQNNRFEALLSDGTIEFLGKGVA